MLDRGILFIVEPGKYLYKNTAGSRMKNNIFFVIHGEFEYVHDDERFGDRVQVGLTVGEEVLFEKPPLK